ASRNVDLIREVRGHARRLPAELISERRRKALRRPGCPVSGSVDAERSSRIEEIEKARAIASRTLDIDVAADLIALIDGLVQASLHAIRMLAVNQRELVVVTRAVRKVRQWEQIHQSPSLRTNAFWRNDISGERDSDRSRRRIDEL